MKKIFKYPKEIYIFWIVEFLLGLDMVGSALLIFFKDWGGLNQTEIQTLQSWFMLCIFFLEIPTGVFGDIKGKKFSVILGYLLSISGVLVYTIVPNIWLFILAEFLFALGIAFISGSKEAWMYDISKKRGIENKFREISVAGGNLNMVGMILASLLFAPLSKLLPIHVLFRTKMVTELIAVILLALLIPSTDGNNKSLKPDYIGTAKEGFKILKNNFSLRRVVIFSTLLSSTSYFVLWFYQEALSIQGIPKEMFGEYRIILLVAEIIMAQIGVYLLKKKCKKPVYILMTIIVAIGFFISATMHNIFGISALLFLTGGLGLQIRRIFSKEINEHIHDDSKRATVLSFVSMARRLVLTVFNPLMGYIVDISDVYIAFILLGIISLLAIFALPKLKK